MANLEETSSEGPILQSLRRGLLILDLFEDNPELGIRDIARRLEMSPATAFRVVTTLCSAKYVVQDKASKRYRLGPRITVLARSLAEPPNFRRLVLSYLQRYQELTQETVAFHERRGSHRVCLLQLESPQELRMVVPLTPLEMQDGATDKVFLAFDPAIDIVRAEVSAEAKLRMTSVTESELDEIRNKGWSASYGVRIAGGTAIAAPVKTLRGLYALSLFGPRERIIDEGVESLGETTKTIASELGQALSDLEAIAADPVEGVTDRD